MSSPVFLVCVRKHPGFEAEVFSMYIILIFLHCEVFEPEVVDHVVEHAVGLVFAVVVGNFHNGVFELDDHHFVIGLYARIHAVEPHSRK